MFEWWDDDVAPAGQPLAAEGSLGVALRAARYAKVWSQKELAAKSGVTQSVISRMERGLRSNWAIFCRLLDAMELEPVVTTRRRRTELELEVERLAGLSAAQRLAEHQLYIDWLPELLPATGWALDGDAALLAHGVPVSPTRYGIALEEQTAELAAVRALRDDWNAPFDFRIVPALPPHLQV